MASSITVSYTIRISYYSIIFLQENNKKDILLVYIGLLITLFLATFYGSGPSSKPRGLAIQK